MAFFSVPSIFWITLFSLAFILALVTLLGRALATLYPHRLRGHARFYLSPVLGLALLTLIASMLGRIVPLGNSVILPIFIVSLLVWALIREPHAVVALRHAMIVSAFGIFCGASIFGPLYVFGAFNAHNDGFTYLVHANWLQEHAFREMIAAQCITPLTTQVSLYQQAGFRMGGSFLLALAQALFNLRWSYEAYPAVLIAAIAACCLAIGFPLARSFQPMRRATRLALLTFPAFSLGGLIFGANLGFLPQTIGLTMGAGLLFSIGPTLRWLAGTDASIAQIVRAVIPAGMLLAAAVYAYSELAPFLLAAILGSGALLALRPHGRVRLLLYMPLLFALSGLLLNTELIRAYSALHTQSSAVVGSPVNWSLLGFVAHSVGVHGGAWDRFQWAIPDKLWSISFFFGAVLSGQIAVILLMARRAIWRIAVKGEMLPTAMILLVFIVAFLYFRYLVPSPFTLGIGQSWSQFKLAEWAHPFATAFVIFGAINLRENLGKYFKPAVISIFLLGLVSASFIGVKRTTPLVQYYGGTHDLNKFYQDFQKTVSDNCPLTAPIFLALNGPHHKFRQMAVCYLPDREVRSDWMDDGYIYSRLPIEHQTQMLMPGDCVIEPRTGDGWLNQGATIGPFRVGMYDGKGRVRITSATGAYDRETEAGNWWHWVGKKVVFELQPSNIAQTADHTKLKFEYSTRSAQDLTIIIQTQNNEIRQFVVHSEGKETAVFEKVMDLPPNELTEFSVETDGQATRLSEQDARQAAWAVRNVSIIPISL